MPVLALPPTTPSTDQVTEESGAPCSVALNCWVPATARSADEGDNVNACNDTVTAAFALAEVSATLVAVMVCEPALEGAVYRPLELMVPVLEFPPLTPSIDHVTDVFADPVTVAVNWVVAPAAIFAEVGLRETVIAVGGGGDFKEVLLHPTRPSESANTENSTYSFDEEKLGRERRPMR